MDYEKLNEKIISLKAKYNLVDFAFDIECIYELGDLSALLKDIMDKTIPEKLIMVTETLSDDGEEYIATLSNGKKSIQINADSFSDMLPDHFFMELEAIPETFDTAKKYYSINPAIGLTGQDAWYFCGTETDLQQARKEGIPLIFPGEDYMETDEYKQFN